MTSPPASGFPDWQAYANWRSDFSVDDTVSVLPGDTTIFGPFPCNNYSTMMLNVGPQTDGGTITVEYGDDPADMKANLFQVFNMYMTSGLQVLIPLLGNYVQLAFGGNPSSIYSADVLFNFNNIPVPRVQYPVTSNLISQQGVSIPANGSKFFNPPWVVEGDAWLCVDPEGLAGHLSVYVWTLNYAGATQSLIFEMANIAAPINQRLLLPAYPIAVEVANGTAAAGNVNVSFYTNGGN